MATVLLPILPGTLPSGSCFPDEQSRLVAYAELMQAVLASGMSFYNFGSDTPDVENQGFPWINTNDMRIYYFAGNWITPVNYDLNERRFWAGSLLALESYDGGTPGTAGEPQAGPMWVEDTAFIGRSPMHPGIVPTANPPKTLAVGENYGAGSHSMTVTEMPAHTHPMEFGSDDVGSGFPAVSTDNVNGQVFNTESTGGGEAMSLVHPVRGLFVIRWSGRLYRVA